MAGTTRPDAAAGSVALHQSNSQQLHCHEAHGHREDGDRHLRRRRLRQCPRQQVTGWLCDGGLQGGFPPWRSRRFPLGLEERRQLRGRFRGRTLPPLLRGLTLGEEPFPDLAGDRCQVTLRCHPQVGYLFRREEGGDRRSSPSAML